MYIWMCVCVPTLIQRVQSGAYGGRHGYLIFLTYFLLHRLNLRGLPLLARVDELGRCAVDGTQKNTNHNPEVSLISQTQPPDNSSAAQMIS